MTDRVAAPRAEEIWQMARARIRWAIQHRGKRDTWGGALGIGWMDPKVEHRYCDCWPASFRTRREARAMSRHLREKFRYLAEQDWRFRPLKIVIVVTEYLT